MSDMGDESTGVDTAAVMAALTGESYDAPTDDSHEEYEAPVTEDFDPGEDDTDQYEDDDSTDDDLGPDPDLSDLDPAQRAFLEKRINDLRGNYTQKTTEIAPLRELLQNAGGNAQDIQDAYEFAQALQNDPNVRAQLFAALKAEAEQGGNQTEATPDDDPFSEYDLPPEIKERLSKVDQLDRRFAELDAREAAAAEKATNDAYVQEVVDNLSGWFNDATESYPDLLGSSPAEAKAIEQELLWLGAGTRGDMGQALDAYRSIEARAQNRLRNGSARVAGGAVTPPRGAGHSTEPPEPITDFKEAGEAAFEYLSALNSQD